jgi:ABC-type antimicrobial peptide transport system permease subunit
MDNFWGNEKFLSRGSVYVIRTDRAGSQSLLAQLRQAVWSVAPDVPIVGVKTMEEVFRGSMARSQFTLVMLGIAGAMALLLGIVGIYGVISYSVSQRTRELGIRVALGAGNAELRAMVVGQGILLAGIGVGVGLLVAGAATRIMSSLLFETSPMDPVTYVLASAGLLGAAAIASYLPAHRASSVNPVEALRME